MKESPPNLFTRLFRHPGEEENRDESVFPLPTSPAPSVHPVEQSHPPQLAAPVPSVNPVSLQKQSAMRLSLSAGKIEAYRQCPFKYKCQFLERRGGSASSHFLSFDSSIHRALNEFFRQKGQLSFDRLRELLKHHWDSRGYENPEQEREFLEAAEEGLSSCVSEWAASPPRVASLDVALNAHLFGCEYFVRADRVDRTPDGRFIIIDYKSGRKPPDEPRLADDPALLNLFLAANARQPGKIAAVVWHFVTMNKSIRLEPTPAQLDAHGKTMDSLLTSLRAGEFPTIKGSLCGWCDFQDNCPAWPVRPHELAHEPRSVFQKRLRLSYSKLSLFEKCPRAYKISYIDRVPSKPRPFFSFGTCIHEVFERLYAPDGSFAGRVFLTLDDVLQLLDRVWENHRTGYSDSAMEETYKQNAVRQISLFYKRFIMGRPIVPAHAIESYFELPIGKHVVMTGFIDRIDRLEDGSFEILDYKTESTQRSQADVHADKQLSTYYWAVTRSLGLPVSRLSLFMLQFDEKIETHRSENDLLALENHVDEVGQKIVNETQFLPKKNKFCRSCDHLETCPLRADIVSDTGIIPMQNFSSP